MIILGIDPGLRTTGFGVIQQQGPRLRYIASGTIKSGAGDLPTRLKVILDGVAEVARTYQPECAAIEQVFVNVNPQSTLLLGQARGAAICALVSAELSVAEYSPTQIKQAVVGTGRAVKSQVQDMVARLLSLPGLPGTDAADALGIAICHAHSRETLGFISMQGQISSGAAGKRSKASEAEVSFGNARLAEASAAIIAKPAATGGPLAGLRMRRGRLVG